MSARKRLKDAEDSECEEDQVGVRPVLTGASRKLSKFVAGPHRIHFKEYGDQTFYPCGSIISIDQHYAACDLCDCERIICELMNDHVQQLNETNNTKMPTPSLNWQIIDYVLTELNTTPKEVQSQPTGWTIDRPIEKWNSLKMEFEPMKTSFYEKYMSLPNDMNLMGMRPPLLNGDVLRIKKNGNAACIEHRTLALTHEAFKYVFYQAWYDGVLSSKYVDLVLFNFGITKKKKRGDNDVYDNYCKYSGVKVDRVGKEFSLQSIDDTKLSKEDETNGWGVSDIIPDDYGFFSLSPTYKVHCEKKGKPWSAFKTPHGADARKMALRETPWYQEISVDANLTIQHCWSSSRPS